MNILYYYWNENCKNDCVESMEQLGHTVKVWTHEIKNHSNDPAFTESINKTISSGAYDCIFSFNYFPLLSEAASKFDIPYFSWVYDSLILLSSQRLLPIIQITYSFLILLCTKYTKHADLIQWIICRSP